MIILLLDHQPNIITRIKQNLQTRYGLTDIPVSTRFIRDLPRNSEGYTLDHLTGPFVTEYYPLHEQAHIVDSLTDIDTIADIIASDYIVPEVWFTDHLPTAREWLSKLPQLTCWDIETTGLKRPAIEQITMSAFSINTLRACVFIHTTEIEQLIMEYLTTTSRTIGVHNILYEQRYVYDRTGKFIHNWEDSQLLAAVYFNCSPKPPVGLKHLAKYPYSDWANGKESFDLYADSVNYNNPNIHYVGDNIDYKQYNLPLVYYNGIDVMATQHLLNKYMPIEPTFTKVSIESILPIPMPKDHSESIRYFYENVMKPIIKPIVKMLANGMPIDTSQLPALRNKVETIRANAYKAFITHPLIVPYVEAKQKADIAEFLAAPSLANFVPVTIADCSITEYKNVVVINQFIFEHTFACAIDGKPLSFKQMKEFDQTYMPAVLVAILNKQPLDIHQTELTELIKQYQIYWMNKQNNIHNRLDKITNPTKYIYPNGEVLNPQSSTQMGEMWNALGVSSVVITKGGAESFNKSVLEDLSQTHPDEQIRAIMTELLHIAEGRNLIAQYLPRYEQSSYGNKIAHLLKFPGTLSFRLSGGGDSLDKDHPDKYRCGINGVTQPASTSKYYKEVKQLFKSTDPEWLIYQIDFEGLTKSY